MPFPSSMDGIPASYAGPYQRGLWFRHHVAIGGAPAPDTAKEAPGVFGLVAD